MGNGLMGFFGNLHKEAHEAKSALSSRPLNPNDTGACIHRFFKNRSDEGSFVSFINIFAVFLIFNYFIFIYLFLYFYFYLGLSMGAAFGGRAGHVANSAGGGAHHHHHSSSSSGPKRWNH